jgi:hypothetical protein
MQNKKAYQIVANMFKLAEFSPEETEIANKTSRSSGAVSSKAIVPKYVAEHADKEHKILDFGAGKDAVHAKGLREKGFDVTAHEFGKNQQEGIHEPNALKKKYDHVYASNVLNVQSSPQMLSKTLDQIHNVIHPGGHFTANFPNSPRKSSDIDAEHVHKELAKRFENVERVGGTKKAPLFHASNPKL